MSSEKPQFLTQTQAEARAILFKQESIHYNLNLRYNKGANYEGLLEIQFELSDLFTQDSELLLDFNGKTISSLYVNDKKVENVVHDGLFIHLTGKDNFKLKSQNIILISFRNEYANDGNGLHSFTDTDGKQYIYSQCEAYFCNRIFPCFDQPDLKATLSLEIDAPTDFAVLFNTSADKNAQKANEIKSFPDQYQSAIQEYQKETNTEYVHTSFPKTLLLPTYLFGFIAGPFKIIPNPNSGFRIPMNLYCRESLFEHLSNMSTFIFEVTEQCMDVYEKFFGCKYVFPKYDQIFCPEFNCGAMENAGLVTFNDLYVFKEEVEATKMTNFANTITHELAHHWFGNLVTMKWWNDLWLNESFADFISHFALSKMNIKSKKTSDVWTLFNNRKGWGYRADQLATTHPIAGDVRNTEEAESIFDGITYSKGASCLKQLLSLMGEDAFSKAMTKYFATYAFKNATLQDFINNLNEEFSNPDFTLQQWKESWICTSGLNTVEPLFNPQNLDQNASLTLVQSVALENHATLRYHKIQIAFIKEDGTLVSQNVLLKPQKETVIQYDGSQQYKACVLNYQDESFVKIILDQHSIQYFKKNLHKISDLLTRTLIWRAFYDMVRDGSLSSQDYIELFINSIPQEVEDELISNQFSFVSVALDIQTPNQFQKELADKLFNFSVEYLAKIDPTNTNRISAVRSKFLSFAKTDSAIQTLLSWYEQKNEILKNVPLVVSNEWTIVSKVFKSQGFDIERKKALFAIQSAKDQSDTQQNMKAKCDAYIADSTERERLFKLYIDKNQKEMSLRTIQYSMGGFNNSAIKEQLQGYYDQWYNLVASYAVNCPRDQFTSFFNGLFPEDDNVKNQIERLNQILESQKSDLPLLTKSLKESIDDLQRKLKAHNCFYKNASMAQNQTNPNL